ncbi:MAG: TonB-dependent receptor plug domain-containing protein [Bacteroidales bacterium]|nr:TonB-dependent receptor plug domain-containing protein [Bacteroidales bacterium]
MTKTIHFIRYYAFFVFQLSFLLSEAQQLAGTLPDADSVAIKSLSEVVITASRSETILMRTPEAIRVTSNKSIRDHQLRTSPEALQHAPGVFIQKTNHGGGSPFLRGLTGNQTLLLIDGIRLSNATSRYGPNQYFNTIDVFSLGRIEVLNGSGSVQYGSDAIGGTIQAFSREAATTEKPEWGAELLSRFGTHGMEQSLHGNLSFSGKMMAFIAGSSLRNFGDPVGGDTSGRQTPGSYKELDIDFKGLIALSSNSKLTFACQRVFQENVWVYHKVALENYSINKMNPQMRELAYIRLNQKFNKGVFRHATITASLQRSEEGRELQKTGSDILRLENDKVNTFSVTADLFTSAGKIWTASSELSFTTTLFAVPVPIRTLPLMKRLQNVAYTPMAQRWQALQYSACICSIFNHGRSLREQGIILLSSGWMMKSQAIPGLHLQLWWAAWQFNGLLTVYLFCFFPPIQDSELPISMILEPLEL